MDFGRPFPEIMPISIKDAETDRLAVPVGLEHVALARDASARFGRGRHAAALNFGDCFSYALAASSGEPLLFVGEDFRQTDIECVPW